MASIKLSSGPGYSELHKKTYNLIVYEFGGFENVLCDAAICAIPIII